MFEFPAKKSTLPAHSIAVIGLAGRFPDAPDLETFWSNIRDGVESLRTFTTDEMSAAGIPAALQKNPRFVRKGTVLDDSEMFDAEFFQISPGEAQMLDPQQRLFLECAWEALENAGYPPGGPGGPVGLYAGVSMNTYLMFHILSNRKLAEAAGAYQLMLGNDKDFLCTRASYKLDLKGPSVTVQTACSTSLVAVEMACRALARGECGMALAGGVSINFPDRSGYLYQEGMIFSPDGHCRPFDVDACGTRVGAGGGLVVLKRHEDALRDGDTIHAVIRGAAVNNDGAAKAGYTAPSIDGQAEVIAMAQTIAGIEPRTIGYMEAHGTGTPLGDPIEIAALTRAFRDRTSDTGFCRLGALKANIGHLDAAAGIAGLIKAILCLKNAYIPPMVNFREANPKLALDESPFSISAEGTDWVSDGPRRAAVSSFGIGGTNAHLILEEAGPAQVAPPPSGPQALVLSARTQAALTVASTRLADRLTGPDEPALGDVAHTLLNGRRAFRHRRFVVASDAVEAAAELRLQSRSSVHDGGARRVAFMFSGQGSQHAEMGAGLYAENAAFREAFDTCSEILEMPLGCDLRAVVLQGKDARLDETWLTQPALFAVEYALARLWIARGIVPAAMIGHSIGEYVAAHLAGVMSLEDALNLVALRGQLMQDMVPGSMAAVPLPVGDLRRRLAGRAEIAAENALDLNVISGQSDVIAEFVAELSREGVTARLLRTSHAFHSCMMEPALDRFVSAVEKVRLSDPTIDYVSNVSGTWITRQEATSADYYARHLRNTVKFEPGVRVLGEDARNFLLEVGPGTTLATLAQMTLPASRGRICASLSHPNDRKPDSAAVLEATGRLWAAGVPITQTEIEGGAARAPRRVPLPTYPFERSRHWVDPAPGTAPGFAAGPDVQPPRVTSDPFLSLPVWTTAPAALRSKLDGRWLVLVDTIELAEALTDALRRRGAQDVVAVLPGDAPQSGAVAKARPGHPEDLLAAIGVGGMPIAGIVAAWGLVDHTIDGRAAFDAGLSLAHVAQETPLAAPVQVICVTAGAQSVLGEPVERPDMALITGPVLALSAEEPRFRMRHLDLLPTETEKGAASLAEVIADEACCKEVELTCARRAGIRFHRRFDPAAAPDAGPPLRENAVCLITGGLGALGRRVALALAEVGSVRLILTSRKTLPPRTEWARLIAEADPTAGVLADLLEIEQRGSEVMLAACDMGDEEGLARLRNDIVERWGNLDAIIHAAGEPGGGALALLQTPEDVTNTLVPKVDGLRALARVFGKDPLDLVVLMSSINSVVPLAGAVDYAAANAFLDVWPQSSERPVGWSNVTVFNWDAWAEVGMAARRLIERPDPDLRMIDVRAATDLFLRLSGGSAHQIVISPYDLAKLAVEAKRALLTPDRDKQSAEAAVAEPVGSDFASRERFDSDQEFTVALLWAELLQTELSGPDEDFFELGGHSLMATRFLTRLEATASVRLSLRDVFDGRTIRAIAKQVEMKCGATAEQGDDADREEFLL
ncbi:type I polyketide synthase [Oceaniovalibus sp. ACAM 378]|uniref:type I polyketide synthase n=1 Tax=Oceaniovalibus sp. ACAM 378 TaxID=2599923 RepID=UPI0011D331B7|nr:type I polyketide synthase [Oceaniovalibus sp. ACAM 378]TYB85045.1 SDR family NAD(P)-dependent oxidoreductase [Oceaniovalibus sp. ACAM 378]